MTVDYEQKFKELKEYVKMRSREEVDLFDKTVYELAESEDPLILEKLIDIFDDECEFHEVMYSLVHAIETYPNEAYVIGVLSKVKDYNKYPEWFQTILYRILNDKQTLEILEANIRIADKDKMLELLEIINMESEQHREIVYKLKQIVNTQSVKFVINSKNN